MSHSSLQNATRTSKPGLASTTSNDNNTYEDHEKQVRVSKPSSTSSTNETTHPKKDVDDEITKNDDVSLTTNSTINFSRRQEAQWRFSVVQNEIAVPKDCEDDNRTEIRRKEAAAAARKRRKRALARCRKKQQRQMQRQKLKDESPRSVSHTLVFQGPPLTGLSTSDHQDHGRHHNHDAFSSLGKTAADEDNSTYSSDSNTCGAPVYSAPIHSVSATQRIEATVDGLAQVASHWRQQDIVAIPTECTYEACMTLTARSSDSSLGQQNSLDMSLSAQAWADRIRQLRQVVGGCPERTLLSPLDAPYCYVPRTALCPWLKECFPPRVYAMRDANSDSRTGQMAHKFSEVHEVLMRVARHVWPGPVTIHVAIPYNQPCKHNKGIPTAGTTSTTTRSGGFHQYWSNLTTITAPPCSEQHAQGINDRPDSSSPSSSCPHLTLRCPRHPLAVKATQHHHVAQQNNTKATTKKATSQTEMIPKSLSILVGFPIVNRPLQQKHNQQQSKVAESMYCCTSEQVRQRRVSSDTHSSSITAVLDGENQHELFAVPTCEYREPWQTQIWIHGPSRTITVVQPPSVQQAQSPQHHAAGSVFGASINNNRFNHLNNENANEAPFSPSVSCLAVATTTSEVRLRAALRQRVPNAQRGGVPLTKAKERIVQAVLYQWKIVMIEK